MLTGSQQSTLKQAILADPVLNAFPNTSDGNFDLANHLSITFVPTFFVWRTDVSTKDVKAVIVWTEYVASSDAERDAFSLMTSNHIVDASNPNVRQGIQQIFGSPQQATTLNNLLAIAKRSARLIEKILATGTGTTGSPATMTFEGLISGSDVHDARNS